MFPPFEVFTLDELMKVEDKYLLLTDWGGKEIDKMNKVDDIPKKGYASDVIYPNFYRYRTFAYITGNGVSGMVGFEETEASEELIKGLKKVYGFVDPWDDPHYFDDYIVEEPVYECKKGDMLYQIEADPDPWSGIHLRIYKNERLVFDQAFVDRARAMYFAENICNVQNEDWEGTPD